jgi:outer membrane receptor protein involved in Fe transport
MEGADANNFVDVYASYQVNQNVTVQAGIDNLTNQYAIALPLSGSQSSQPGVSPSERNSKRIRRG